MKKIPFEMRPAPGHLRNLLSCIEQTKVLVSDANITNNFAVAGMAQQILGGIAQLAQAVEKSGALATMGVEEKDEIP